jgi:hypothetical protein
MKLVVNPDLPLNAVEFRHPDGRVDKFTYDAVAGFIEAKPEPTPIDAPHKPQ